MQVGKILDAVEGFTAAGMVEASPAPATDAERAQMAPDADQQPALLAGAGD